MAALGSSAKSLVDQILSERWNAYLRTFVRDTTAFRALLRQTRSVISGSSALHFLLDTPSIWNPADCDIYVRSGYSTVVIDYLRRVDGYEFSNTPSTRLYYDNDGRHRNPAVAFVNKLKRRDGISIDIVESSTDCSLHPLPYFWSTHLINYVSADAFCIPYPALTLSLRGCLRSATNPRVGDLVSKYKKRGFIISSFSDNNCLEVRRPYPQ